MIRTNSWRHWLPLVFLCFSVSFLAACGGSDNGSAAGPVDSADTEDTTPATASIAPTDDLGIRESVVITFDEAMDPGSLNLGGDLGPLSDGGTWSNGDTVLTLAPADGAWESGLQGFTIEVDDEAGNTTSDSAEFAIRLVFTNFQAASVVIGQPDFTSDDPNQGGGTPQANTLGEGVYGTSTVAGNRLWVADYDNHRALGFDGIPAANNASASWVVGQPDFISDTAGTSATEFTGIQQAIEHNGFFYLLEYDNHRVTTFDSVPLTPPGTASHVLGQPDLTSNTPACSASGMFEPETMFITDNRLLVADAGNHRVLVWNTLPISTDGQAPDLVLGQGVFDSCAGNDDDQNGAEDTATARTLDLPTAVWSDGTRLVVLDSNNHRVLIWNTFPDSHFAPADVVLGQSDFVHGTANDDDQDDADDGAPSARTLAFPYEGIWSNGLQLFVSDTANNRILIWNDFPTENFVPADVVLGQSDFTRNTANDDDQDGADDATPSERTLNGPVGLTTSRDKLVLHDQNNSRALVFESE